MKSADVAVVKVGGSLFEVADLTERLGRWLDERRVGGHTILVAGGGRRVEAIRRADREHSLGEEAAHWRCVRAMSETAAELSKHVASSRPLTDMSELTQRMNVAGITVTDCEPFLRTVEPTAPGTRLPYSWDVTSDSIAARLAVVIGALELVLLKSADPPAESWHRLAELNYVDRFFPTLVGELPRVRVVNLRAGNW